MPFEGLLVLSWPADASAFTLQGSPVFPGSAADWTDITDVLLVGDRYNFGVDTDPSVALAPRQFYRLVRR